MRHLLLATDARCYVSLGDAQSRNPLGVVGAASGFYNRLVAVEPGAKMVPLATDGGTAATVRYVQLPRLFAINIAPSVLTITLGAGDVSRMAFGDAASVCAELADHGRAVLGAVRRAFPRCVVLLATLYDPMDGADAVLAGGVTRFNSTLLALAVAHGCRVADACAAFGGHGAGAGDPLTSDVSPPNADLYLCAGSDLVPVPNAHGAAIYADALWAAYTETVFPI